MNLEYRLEHLGVNSGQDDMELGLYNADTDDILGYVSYTLYNGELTVKNIVVHPDYRRLGLGSRMMQYIKKEHPNYKYVQSGLSELGAKFKHKDIKDLSKTENKKMSRKYIHTFESFKSLNENDNLDKSNDALDKFGMGSPIQKYIKMLNNTNDLWEYDKISMALEEDGELFHNEESREFYTKFHRQLVPAWAREHWNKKDLEFNGLNLRKDIIDKVQPVMEEYMQEKGLSSDLVMVAYEVGSNGLDDDYADKGVFKMGFNVWKDDEDGPDATGIYYFKFNVPSWGDLSNAKIKEKEGWNPNDNGLDYKELEIGAGSVMGEGNFNKNNFSHPGNDLADWLGDGGVIIL